jgi:hypothetical protein
LKDSEAVRNYALGNCKDANTISLRELDESFNKKGYEDFASFIIELNKPEIGLNFKDLQVRSFLESYIQMYESTMLLSLESFPYFFYNMIGVTNGSYINNQYVLEDMVGNHAAKIYVDLLRVFK